MVGNHRRVAAAVLYGLLLVLALRMTMTETSHELLSQTSVRLVTPSDANGQGALPEIGPAVVTGLAAATVFLTAAAAWCAARIGGVSREKLGQLAVIGLVLACGAVSTFAAANKFIAVVGLCDLAMGILGGWAVAVLCHQTVLGNAGRRLVIAALLGILATWAAKGLYQRTIDIPETIKYYLEHKDESLAQALGPTHRISEGDPEVKLFESRMLSREVTGFVTLSNVMGTGMVGLLAVLAGVVGARRVEFLGKKERPEGVPLSQVLTIGAVVLGGLGIVVLFLTASRGASVIGVGAVAAIAGGAFCWKTIGARRRQVVGVVAALWVLAAASIVGFGLSRDRLPGKSLTFRWHYWTASSQLVKESPWWGIGLNNFGDYYTSVKRASSPENVTDPHSFFVRAAVEMGLPATALVGVLILWMAISATRRGEAAEEAGDDFQWKSALAAGAFFCGVWWLIHQVIAEPADEYYMILTALSAVMGMAGWAVAAGLLSMTGGRGIRFIAVACLVGAIGMMLYDQINMALVTGPVAMLFWMLLGVADSFDGRRCARPRVRKTVTFIASGGFGLASILIAAVIWWPTLRGTMPWDPSPYVRTYLQATMRPASGSGADLPAAKAALSESIARAPRSIELRLQMLFVKVRLREPVADDIRAMLKLDHANARLRMNLAVPDSDLPKEERIAALRQALNFDSQLPVDEVMRLGEQNRAMIETKINALAGAPATSK